MKQAILTVTGMHCGGCVASVERVLDRLPGLSERRVEVGRVTVSYDEGALDERRLREAIDDAGFEVSDVSIS